MTDAEKVEDPGVREVRRGELFYRSCSTTTAVPVPANLRTTSSPPTEPIEISPRCYSDEAFHWLKVERVGGGYGRWRPGRSSCRRWATPSSTTSLTTP